MTRIVLVRHGHVEGITPERFRGRLELALSEQGQRQIELTARYVARVWQPAQVYTSPMSRCVATGQAIARECGVGLQTVPELNDLDYGSWQGMTHDDVRHNSLELYRLWREKPHLMQFPKGESLVDLAERVSKALRWHRKQHSDATLVVVSHDSTNRAMLLAVLGLPLSDYWLLRQDPCGVSEFVLHDTGRTVVRINETAHLLER